LLGGALHCEKKIKNACFLRVLALIMFRRAKRAQNVRKTLNSAGWSSLVARRAHNPEVVGSNPTPATSKTAGQRLVPLTCFVFLRAEKWTVTKK
jgi:hypothetical protein